MMKITKRQLKRIIKEEKRKLLEEAWDIIDDPNPAAAGVSRTPSRSGSAIEDSIQRALETNTIMSGIELIDYVQQDIPGHVYHQRVEEYMDEMMDNGLLSWDVEEDEWSLA